MNEKIFSKIATLTLLGYKISFWHDVDISAMIIELRSNVDVNMGIRYVCDDAYFKNDLTEYMLHLLERMEKEVNE